jgi:hypothetical protein
VLLIVLSALKHIKPGKSQNMTESMQKAASFVQNFLALPLRIGAAPLLWSPKTAENPRCSGGVAGYFDEIRANFAPFRGVVLVVFWPVETNSVSIAGWQADELTEQ